MTRLLKSCTYILRTLNGAPERVVMATASRIFNGVEYRKRTFSGLPEEVKHILNEVAAKREILMRDLWTEIIEELLSDIKAGKVERFDATLKGGHRFTIWPPAELLDEMAEICKTLRRTPSSFMFTAVRRYSEKYKLPIEF